MQPKVISSRDNRWFKRFRQAVEEHDDEVVIEGRKQVADCIAAGVEIVALASSDAATLEAHQGDFERLLMSSTLLAALSDTEHSQQLSALAIRPRQRLDDIQLVQQQVVILDRVQDPGNAGTLIRLAAAFGCDAVLALDGTADPFGPKTLRASAGTAFTLPVIRCSSIDALEWCSRAGLQLVAADGAASQELGREKLPPRIALILGNEGSGISTALAAEATGFSIAIDRRVESLNVAAAAAIFLYEMKRQSS